MERSALVNDIVVGLAEEERVGLHLSEASFINRVVTMLVATGKEALWLGLAEERKVRLIRRLRLSAVGTDVEDEDVADFCKRLLEVSQLVEAAELDIALNQSLPNSDLFAQALPVSFCGLDVFGHPVFYLRLEDVNFESLVTIDVADRLKLFCQLFEVQQLMCEMVTDKKERRRLKCVLIIDLYGLSLLPEYFDKFQELLLPLLKALDLLYGGNIWRLAFVDVTEVYHYILSAVRPWLLGNVASGISVFQSARHEETKQLLIDFGIPIRSIPPSLGGTAKLESLGGIVKELIEHPDELEWLDLTTVTNVIPTGFVDRDTLLAKDLNQYKVLFEGAAEFKIGDSAAYQHVHLVLLSSLLMVFDKNPIVKRSKLLLFIESVAVSQLETKEKFSELPVTLINPNLSNTEVVVSTNFARYCLALSDGNVFGEFINCLLPFVLLHCPFAWCEPESDAERPLPFFSARVNWPVSSSKTKARNIYVYARDMLVTDPSPSSKLQATLLLPDIKNLKLITGGVSFDYSALPPNHYSLPAWILTTSNQYIPQQLYGCLKYVAPDNGAQIMMKGCFCIVDGSGNFQPNVATLFSDKLNLLQMPPTGSPTVGQSVNYGNSSNNVVTTSTDSCSFDLTYLNSGSPVTKPAQYRFFPLPADNRTYYDQWMGQLKSIWCQNPTANCKNSSLHDFGAMFPKPTDSVGTSPLDLKVRRGNEMVAFSQVCYDLSLRLVEVLVQLKFVPRINGILESI